MPFLLGFIKHIINQNFKISRNCILNILSLSKQQLFPSAIYQLECFFFFLPNIIFSLTHFHREMSISQLAYIKSEGFEREAFERLETSPIS